MLASKTHLGARYSPQAASLKFWVVILLPWCVYGFFFLHLNKEVLVHFTDGETEAWDVWLILLGDTHNVISGRAKGAIPTESLSPFPGCCSDSHLNILSITI